MEKQYIVEPDYKKSVYEKEEWCYKLENGKIVTIFITTFYRWGSFSINLTEDQKFEITSKDEICFDDYEAEMIEMWDGCDMYVEIDKEHTYTTDEIKHIKCLIYCDQNVDCQYNVDDGNSFDLDILENNGWDIYNTSYGFSCGCILKDIKE